MNINHFEDSVDKTLNMSFLSIDMSNDVYYTMREIKMTQNPSAITKGSVRLGNDFVREQLRDKLLSVHQV
jgi:hypothetical protein